LIGGKGHRKGVQRKGGGHYSGEKNTVKKDKNKGDFQKLWGFLRKSK